MAREASVGRSLGERVGLLRGSITLEADDLGWRDRLRERNSYPASWPHAPETAHRVRHLRGRVRHG